MTDDTDEDGSPSNEDIEDIPSEPPAKHRRISSTERKTCCVEECQESHFCGVSQMQKELLPFPC